MSFRVAVASSSLLALPVIERLRQMPEIDLCGFVSTPDKPKGRSSTPTPNELAHHLQQAGFEVLKPGDDESLFSRIRELNLDLVVVIAYGRLIKESALTLPRKGWINIHFSLLPEYRGAAPVQRALMEGQTRFGFTIFRLDRGMDTGPVFLQEEVSVRESLCATEILEVLAQHAADSFPKVIASLNEDREPVEQTGQVSYAPKIAKSETKIDFEKDAASVIGQIRALTKEPGAWLLVQGRRCIITKAFAAVAEIEPKRLGLRQGKLLLGVLGGSIEIVSLIPEGKREMTGGEFARGMRLTDDPTSDLEVL